MSIVEVFLDTSALIALSGLRSHKVDALKNLIQSGNLRLNVSHIQVDEKVERNYVDYNRRIIKALGTLEKKGIKVCLIPTKIAVTDVSRVELSTIGDEEINGFYDELLHEISECEKNKGKTKDWKNLVCDAIIAVTAIDHDYFITCDSCMYDTWKKVIDSYGILRHRFKIPRLYYANSDPKNVADIIIGIFK